MMESQVIGNVVAVTGKVVLEHNGDSIVLEVGSPVFKGGVVKTGADSHIEIRFTDDTMLSQGANSEVSIDNYVFDQPDSASSILLNLTEGTLRTITGKIAEENPESFEVKSPLATLGIRGTDFSVIHITRPTPKTDVILNQIGENQQVLDKTIHPAAAFLPQFAVFEPAGNFFPDLQIKIVKTPFFMFRQFFHLCHRLLMKNKTTK